MSMEEIDTRAKLAHVILTGAMLFFTKSHWTNIISVLLLALFLCVYRRPLYALKMVLF